MFICRSLPFFILFWQSSPFWQTSAQNQYCSFTLQHTLCNVTQGCGSSNKEIAQGVSQDDVKHILHLHNQFRSKVANGKEFRGKAGPQPSASNMGIMVWDDELARIAQAHANKCNFEHECSDCRRVSRFRVGQNLYMSWSTDLDRTNDWLGAITAWYDEVAEFRSSWIQPFQFSAPVGHYTAMMWHNTAKIGCGYIMFEERLWWKPRNGYKKMYTCNYGPAGNINSNVMYKTGKPCSSCSQSCSNTYPGLCDDNNQNSNNQNSNDQNSNNQNSNNQNSNNQNSNNQNSNNQYLQPYDYYYYDEYDGDYYD